ncbi:MAG TPA: hypothetical protein VNA21_10760 [Steroidobacteraceae bacterium]|nr:hypothetical protein [Steroidobacteraceae bacterium]
MHDATSAPGARRRTNGWLVDPKTREMLLERYPPTYFNVVAHHVTLSSGIANDAGIPEHTRGKIVGRVDDGSGVEAMIVEIGGATDRPGGGTYHITWSLNRAAKREARESNDAIAQFGWQPLSEPQEIELMPAFWEREVKGE